MWDYLFWMPIKINLDGNNTTVLFNIISSKRLSYFGFTPGEIVAWLSKGILDEEFVRKVVEHLVKELISNYSMGLCTNSAFFDGYESSFEKKSKILVDWILQGEIEAADIAWIIDNLEYPENCTIGSEKYQASQKEVSEEYIKAIEDAKERCHFYHSLFLDSNLAYGSLRSIAETFMCSPTPDWQLIKWIQKTIDVSELDPSLCRKLPLVITEEKYRYATGRYLKEKQDFKEAQKFDQRLTDNLFIELCKIKIDKKLKDYSSAYEFLPR